MPIRMYEPTGRLLKDPDVIRFAVEFGMKAAPFFEQHKWYWENRKRGRFIPIASEITDSLLNAMDHLDAQPIDIPWTSSGRIRVERQIDGRWTVTLEAEEAQIDLPNYKPLNTTVLKFQGSA